MPDQNQILIDNAKAVLDIEYKAIRGLETTIDQNFIHAAQCILECKGRVIVTGMGKSGHIGGKIAATLASTGTPAFFVHPGEASHGDLGMITPKDVVLALSHSGETMEVVTLLPLIKRMNVPLIAITGNAQSTLAQKSSVLLKILIEKEACPLDLAPTASTTAALVLGDALAVALLQARGFTETDFALSHPGGSLGKRLLLTVNDLMHSGPQLPRVDGSVTVTEALCEMTGKRLGMTTVFEGEQCIGVFTDGDLRRAIESEVDLRSTLIAEIMTKNPKSIAANALAAEALQTMQSCRINAIVVTDEHQRVIGALNMHDLLTAGVV